MQEDSTQTGKKHMLKSSTLLLGISVETLPDLATCDSPLSELEKLEKDSCRGKYWTWKMARSASFCVIASVAGQVIITQELVAQVLAIHGYVEIQMKRAELFSDVSWTIIGQALA